MHNKQSVLLQVQGHTAFLLLLLYCAVLLNAKLYALSVLLLLLYCAVLLNAKLYALSDDVACC